MLFLHFLFSPKWLNENMELIAIKCYFYKYNQFTRNWFEYWTNIKDILKLY